MNVGFERYKELFDEVKNRYQEVKDLDVILVFKPPNSPQLAAGFPFRKV
ncbi:MAG: hypothetical protein ABIO57_03340 [Candidatus Paceibacterota bacterium]